MGFVSYKNSNTTLWNTSFMYNRSADIYGNQPNYYINNNNFFNLSTPLKGQWTSLIKPTLGKGTYPRKWDIAFQAVSTREKKRLIAFPPCKPFMFHVCENLSCNFFSPQDKKRVLKVCESHFTWREIQFQVSRSTFSVWLFASNL